LDQPLSTLRGNPFSTMLAVFPKLAVLVVALNQALPEFLLPRLVFHSELRRTAVTVIPDDPVVQYCPFVPLLGKFTA
jgi:hypothetical protein